MESLFKMSVVVPVYKVESYIERCLYSIMIQKVSKINERVECLLIDDCSPDRSMAIAKRMIEEYEGVIQFRTIFHSVNRGIAFTRNEGIEEAQGEYIFFLDSDDWIESDTLDTLAAAIQKGSPDIIISDFMLETGCKSIYRKQTVGSTPQQNLIDTLLDRLPAFVWNKLFKKELFTRNGFTIPPQVTSMGEDLLTVSFAFSHAETVVYVPQAFVHYCRKNVNSYCNTIRQEFLESQRQTINYMEKTMFADLEPSSSCYLPFMETKNRVKTAILFYGDRVMRKKYANLWPEARRYLFSYNIRKKRQKLALALVIVSVDLCGAYISLLKVARKLKSFLRR